MKRAILIGVTLIGSICLWACGRGDEIQHIQGAEYSISKDQQLVDLMKDKLLTPDPLEEETSLLQESKETKSKQIQWQVYIQPDMPEPYIEVLKQYQQVVNESVEDFDDREMLDKLGEWRYVYVIYAWRLAWEVEHNEADDNYRYSLKDLTGDGFPELILGYYNDFFDETTPDVVYYYSETEGIKMECLSDYYTMTLYEGGIIEYASAGVRSIITYLQFQEDTEEWELATRVAVEVGYTDQSPMEYYYQVVDLGGTLDSDVPISEEEYQEIIERYVTNPVELEWTPLVLCAEPVDRYFFPQGATFYVYKASFADFGPQQEEKEVVLHITEVQVFEEGTLYELKIDSDVEAPDTHAGYRGDWRDFGLFYVQGDEIYFIRAEEAQSEYQTVDEILNAGTLVCNEAGKEDALGEDQRGWHEFILADGDRREYHGYSTLVETGYYEHFYCEKGKGLVAYESGYGAEADGIKMYLAE